MIGVYAEDSNDLPPAMPPSAFSITIWALVLASIFAPLGFGITLRRRLKAAKDEKEQKEAHRPKGSEAAAVSASASSTSNGGGGNGEKRGPTKFVKSLHELKITIPAAEAAAPAPAAK